MPSPLFIFSLFARFICVVSLSGGLEKLVFALPELFENLVLFLQLFEDKVTGLFFAVQQSLGGCDSWVSEAIERPNDADKTGGHEEW